MRGCTGFSSDPNLFHLMLGDEEVNGMLGRGRGRWRDELDIEMKFNVT
jgi:hypothetical protein